MKPPSSLATADALQAGSAHTPIVAISNPPSHENYSFGKYNLGQFLADSRSSNHSNRRDRGRSPRDSERVPRLRLLSRADELLSYNSLACPIFNNSFSSMSSQLLTQWRTHAPTAMHSSGAQPASPSTSVFITTRVQRVTNSSTTPIRCVTTSTRVTDTAGRNFVNI